MIHDSAKIEGQLDGVNPHLITVGKHCRVGSRAALLTHCPIKGAQPVVLGDYVWIGYGAIVLPGVRIGDHAVVGAGAVVTRDVDARSIVAGCPARKLRMLTEKEVARIADKLERDLPLGKDERSEHDKSTGSV